MFDQLHLGHQIGDFDQAFGGVAPGQNPMGQGRYSGKIIPNAVEDLPLPLPVWMMTSPIWSVLVAMTLSRESSASFDSVRTQQDEECARDA